MITTDPICPHCGMPCETISEDVGIGAYEYEGQKGHHTQTIELSACCRVELDVEPLTEDDVHEIRQRYE
jgi:hypothetical protein